MQLVHILKGGSIETPTEEVTPGVLSALPDSNSYTSPSEWNTIPESLHGRRLAPGTMDCFREKRSYIARHGQSHLAMAFRNRACRKLE